MASARNQMNPLKMYNPFFYRQQFLMILQHFGVFSSKLAILNPGGLKIHKIGHFLQILVEPYLGPIPLILPNFHVMVHF